MATIASKRELNTKSINDKYSALKTVEDGKTKSQVAVKVMHVLMKWSHLGNKLRYELSCPNMTSTRSTAPTNLICFIVLNQISRFATSEE